MGEVTKIEWADHTFNPWIGCTKVSPACDGCYAENLMANRYGRVRWGAGEDRQRTAPANWRKPIAWNKTAVANASPEPTYVFCASLADVFDNEVDPLWRVDLFDLIEATPALTWLLLTKRIGNVMKMTDPLRGCRPLPRNAAVGATMANQEEYDRDRMKLWEVKQALAPAFTFGSFEPLLSLIILDKYAPDWIIVGGETNQGAHKARHAAPDWMRSMRDHARRLERRFFLKQMTNKAAIPADLLVREFPNVTHFTMPGA
jgi:protein gp37